MSRPHPDRGVLASGQTPSCHAAELVAVVAADPPPTDAPCFRPDDVAHLAEFLEARFLAPR